MTPAEPVTVDGLLIERVAKIIDPDAWHEALPTDGCGVYWIMRRHKAEEKARTIIRQIAHELKQGTL